MSPSERVKGLISELEFTPGQFFVGGSGVLALREVRDIGDLDVGVTTQEWFRLHATGDWRVWTTSGSDLYGKCDPPYLIREINGVEVHVFYAWRWRGFDETEYNDYNKVFQSGIETVDGIPCVKLSILLRQKVDAASWAMPRYKDIRDIGLISNLMTQGAMA